MGNIHVKLYVLWTSGSEGDVAQRKSLWTDGWTHRHGRWPTDKDRSQ